MPRNRVLRPAIPYAGLYGSASFTITTSAQPITLDHSCYVTTSFLFVNGSGKLTVRRGTSTGIYRIYASCGATKATGNPSYVSIQMFKNGVACTCGVASGFVGAGSDHSTAILIACIELVEGDYLEWKVSVDDGTATVVDDECRVIVEGLPMKGWDNKRGGMTRKWE